MINIKNYLNWDIFFKTIVLFSVFRFAMMILGSVYYYDCLDDFYWYSFSFVIPAVTSIIVASFLNDKFLFYLGIIYLPLFIVISILGFSYSSGLMGYAFKRPTVFSEVKIVENILSIDTVKKEWDELYFSNEYPLIKKPQTMGHGSGYWYHAERFFIAYESKHGKINYSKILNEENKTRISNEELKFFQFEIIKSKFLDVPAKGYEKGGNSFFIQIVKFNTSENKVYNLVTMMSRTTGLDREEFPLYEFLFDEKGLIKKQKYYYSDDDFGVGWEYPNISPLFEMILLYLVFLMFSIGKVIYKIYIRFR